MTSAHPYAGLADHRHWRRAPGVDDMAALDPVVAPKFTIAPSDRVASAGSCFAQHIMRHLSAAGFNALVTERAPAVLPAHLAAEFQYGVFSTRSGNVYTARQLAQLIARAYGRFVPRTVAWRSRDGFVDPFRPGIDEFASKAELLHLRDQHLAAVREMIETLDVFVFTLGLTEAWIDEDGAVFPLAPGVAGGSYDPARHRFHNFTVAETAADLAEAVAAIRQENPGARFILTVSPVPLMATALDRHVLVSTTHSKAVLRVAAQMVADGDPFIDYFPSYEIITAPQTRGAYYGTDARSVTEAGVRHVIGVFLRHYGGVHAPLAPLPLREAGRGAAAHVAAAEEIVEVLCEEELLGR